MNDSSVVEASFQQPLSVIAHWAAHTPQAPYFSDGFNTVSYADAHSFVISVAAKMRDLGVTSGQVVALELPVGLQTIFTCAAMWEGAVTATFNEAALMAPQPETDWLFSATRAHSPTAQNTVFVDDAFLAALPATQAEAEDSGRAHIPSGGDLCRIAYSSGTTGTPKQVPLTYAMVHHRTRAAMELFEPGRPFMSLLDLATASGFHTFLACLSVGACYLNPGDGRHNASLIESRGVSAIKASPAQIARLLEACTEHGESLASLATIYSAGGTVPVALRQRVRSQTSARLVNLYGSTEVGRGAERVLDDDDLALAGTVVEGTTLEIVDDNDKPVAPGVAGRVRYKRDFMATEYRHSPEASAASFRDGWFYTGDIGSLDSSGQLTLMGRASGVTNVGGVKVNLAEVEEFVIASGLVTDAACFITDAGQGADEVVLALVCQNSADVSPLATSLRERFGSVAPTQLFRLPTLPRTDTGKVSLAELERIYADARARGRANQE